MRGFGNGDELERRRKSPAGINGWMDGLIIVIELDDCLAENKDRKEGDMDSGVIPAQINP